MFLIPFACGVNSQGGATPMPAKWIKLDMGPTYCWTEAILFNIFNKIQQVETGGKIVWSERGTGFLPHLMWWLCLMVDLLKAQPPHELSTLFHTLTRSLQNKA